MPSRTPYPQLPLSNISIDIEIVKTERAPHIATSDKIVVVDSTVISTLSFKYLTPLKREFIIFLLVSFFTFFLNGANEIKMADSKYVNTLIHNPIVY